MIVAEYSKGLADKLELVAYVVKRSNYPGKYVKLVLHLVGYDLHERSVVLPFTSGGFIRHVYLLVVLLGQTSVGAMAL